MDKLAFISIIMSIFFSSCNQNRNTPNAIMVGSMDSSAIAIDTTMEQAIENSYEYSKSLSINEELVYDVLAYGGPASKGEYAILRRGANNKADTVAKGARFGIIKNAFAADLNRNNEPEVYIITQSTDSLKVENLIAYEFDKTVKAKPIKLAGLSKEYREINRSNDSIYLIGNMIVREFRPTGKTLYPIDVKLYYKLKHESLILETEITCCPEEHIYTNP